MDANTDEERSLTARGGATFDEGMHLGWRSLGSITRSPEDSGPTVSGENRFGCDVSGRYQSLSGFRRAMSMRTPGPMVAEVVTFLM